MAKANKGGLGRGLGSLMGDGPSTQSESTLIPEEEKKAPVTPKPEPVVEKEPPTTLTPSETTKKEKPATAKKDAPRPSVKKSSSNEKTKTTSDTKVVFDDVDDQAQANAEIKPYIEEDDHVTIKGVTERAAKTKVTETSSKDENGEEIAIDRIKPNPNQPRTQFKPGDLEELSSSIKKEGLLQPILVRKMAKGEYQIIAGERRWQACKLAGLKNVPVRFKEADDDKALELALIENIQRSDLNPIEEAYGYKRLMERRSMTQSDLAQAVSKGRSTIANALRLLELPEEAQQLLFQEKITAGHARAILMAPTSADRQKITEKLRDEKLSVRETENLARLCAGREKAKEEAKPREPQPKSYKTAAKGLRDALGTNVRIKSSQGKNKIEIEFKNEAELERLFGLMTASIEKKNEE